MSIRPIWEFDRLRLRDAKHPQYSSYSKRLSSFDGWPEKSPIHPEELSAAGLIYFGLHNIVYCYFCNKTLYHFKDGDCAYEIHRLAAPWCPFIQLLYYNNLAIQCPNHTFLVKQKENIPEQLLCKICYVNPLCIVFLPCRHALGCIQCSLKLEMCAVCRCPIEELIPFETN